ncbi:MAG: acetyltransferase [Gammaproteobacteria bacterium SG8_11]|nr:MAG: acetyltransferase [Gammaproteobacteria bacterium SG8_11]
MYLKDKKSGDLVEVLDTKALADPFQTAIQGRFHFGEEIQDPTDFAKSDLIFPSDEPLPQCWLDPNYKKI